MVQLTTPFHLGVRVSNIQEAMDFYSARCGITWYSLQAMGIDFAL